MGADAQKFWVRADARTSFRLNFYIELNFNSLLIDMRVLHLPFIAVLFSLNAPAQKVAVGLPAMNVVYIGLDNEVRIAVEGEKNASLIKELSDGELIEKDGKTYIRVTKRGEIKLRIGVKKRKKIKWVDSMVLRARKIPAAIPQLGTLQNGAIETIGTIKANGSRVYMSLGEGFVFENLRGHIQGFSLTVADSTGFESLKIKGPILDAKAFKLINNLTGGGILYIDSIYYCLTKNNDTVVPIKLSPYHLVITARIPWLLPIWATKEERDAYVPPTPSFKITGGFYGTKTQMEYIYGFSDIGAFNHLTGLLKHGEWNYSSGLINPKIYREEHYDSGRLLQYTIYDSFGFKTLSLNIPSNEDSVYYKELYSNGNIKREGWVIVNQQDYRYIGKPSFYRENVNEYEAYFDHLKFIPAGNWKEYYESGKLKLNALFKTVENYKWTNYYTNETYTYEGLSVMISGKWTVYNENGSIKETFNYD